MSKDEEMELVKSKTSQKKGAKNWLTCHFWGAMIVVAIMLVAVLVTMVMSYVSVPAGHKAVVVSAPDNDYIGRTFNEGWHFNPYFILCDIEIIRYNIQTIEFSVVGTTGLDVYGPVNIRTYDNLEVYLDFAITFHLPADKVSYLRVNYGDYKQTILQQVARSVPRDIGSQYNALELAGPKRPMLETAIGENLTAELAKHYIIVDEFNLREIQLPLAVSEAVEAKKVAEQKLIEAGYIRNTTITLAEGTAQAIIINATAQAEAIVLMADGNAEAIYTIITQMTEIDSSANITTYLTWLYLQALMSPDSNISYVIITDGEGVPIILNPEGV